MKIRLLLLLCITATIVVGCGVKQSEYDNVKHECDSVKNQLEFYKKQAKKDSISIAKMHDTISMLSYPADQRLVKINNLVSEGNYHQAKSEMNELSILFPESKEAQSIPALTKKIDNLIAKQKAEEEKRKALGFKGLKKTKSATIGYNKVSFSYIKVDKSYHFDWYHSGGRMRTADRGNVYVVATMSVTSSSKDPNLPTLAVYSIKGDRMTKVGVMEVRFDTWSDYGCYLGNYHDSDNDFAKTATIKFSLGVEVSEDITSKPYAIVLKKSNGLYRYEDKYNNPPVSYKGSVSYPHSLSLDDFTRENSDYVVVKISNL